LLSGSFGWSGVGVMRSTPEVAFQGGRREDNPSLPHPNHHEKQKLGSSVDPISKTRMSIPCEEFHKVYARVSFISIFHMVFLVIFFPSPADIVAGPAPEGLWHISPTNLDIWDNNCSQSQKPVSKASLKSQLFGLLLLPANHIRDSGAAGKGPRNQPVDQWPSL